MNESHLEITDGELEEMLDALPGERITPDFLRAQILKTEYVLWPPGSTNTICAITLKNGYVLHGTAACADPTNYKEEVGRLIAHNNAFNQLWPLYGFALKELLTRRQIGQKADREKAG
jgi:hypothetical protein